MARVLGPPFHLLLSVFPLSPFALRATLFRPNICSAHFLTQILCVSKLALTHQTSWPLLYLALVSWQVFLGGL